MTEETEISKEWREEISDTPAAVFKLTDGETKTFVFMNEGEKRIHADFGTSIVFQVKYAEEEMYWYVTATNYDLLRQIKALGEIVGMKARVSRTGSKKSDTRYKIEKSE